MTGRPESCPTTATRRCWSCIRPKMPCRSRSRWGPNGMRPESFNKAAALLSQAQDMSARKMDTHAIVSAAREAAQMAEDARTIAVRRRDEERHSQEMQRSQDQSELRRRREDDAAQARAEAEAGKRRAGRRCSGPSRRGEAETTGTGPRSSCASSSRGHAGSQSACPAAQSDRQSLRT